MHLSNCCKYCMALISIIYSNKGTLSVSYIVLCVMLYIFYEQIIRKFVFGCNNFCFNFNTSLYFEDSSFFTSFVKKVEEKDNQNCEIEPIGLVSRKHVFDHWTEKRALEFEALQVIINFSKDFCKNSLTWKHHWTDVTLRKLKIFVFTTHMI